MSPDHIEYSDGGNKIGYRIALYSHDTMGLGHMRRNLLLAQTLLRSRLDASVLVVSGAYFANNFAIPLGVDCLTLPALHKIKNGSYSSRSLRVGIEEIIDIRKRTICAGLEAFEPDVLIIDNVPRGAHRELDMTLEKLSSSGKTRFVLGLRDVLDDPLSIESEWALANNQNIILRYFDQIWVYGDPRCHNLANIHNFSSEVADKIRYTGYFDQRKRLEWAPGRNGKSTHFLKAGTQGKRLALCIVGGGEDGAPLAKAFALADLPSDFYGVVVTGPLMPETEYKLLLRLASANPRLEVVRQLEESTEMLQAADRVISMGGYNSVSEALSFGKQTLIVPRVFPRQEQLIRARRLNELGLIHYLHPDAATPENLTEWLARSLPPLPHVEEFLDMNGLRRLPLLLEDLLADTHNGSQTLARQFSGGLKC